LHCAISAGTKLAAIAIQGRIEQLAQGLAPARTAANLRKKRLRPSKGRGSQ
jgi:hypothetical protein